jgi:hypothetical protein
VVVVMVVVVVVVMVVVVVVSQTPHTDGQKCRYWRSPF